MVADPYKVSNPTSVDSPSEAALSDWRIIQERSGMRDLFAHDHNDISTHPGKSIVRPYPRS